MIKEKRKRKKNLKKGLLICLAIVLSIVISALIVINVFTVKNVVVEGNELYSDEQIKSLVINDEYSWNSLYLLLKYRFRDIGEVPFVDTMEIALDNPHTVRIIVYEKGILGCFYLGQIRQYAYFDKDGFVVETSFEQIEGIPTITGISCNEVVLYEKLPLQNEKMLQKLLALTQMLEKYDIFPDEIHYDKNLRPILAYGDIAVIVGTDDYLSQKVVRLAVILPQLEGLAGTLHLESWTPDTTDIVFDKNTK